MLKYSSILFILYFTNYCTSLNLSNLTFFNQLIQKSSYSLINVDPYPTASLGRVAELGEFYDARTDNFIKINLFSDKVPSSLISSTDNACTDMKFSMANSLQDKFNELDVDARLQLSFRAGLVDVELGGSANYLQHNKHSARSARVTLIESINTRFESLSLTDRGFKNLINFDALSRFDVTHILVGIQWGGKLVLDVEDSNQFKDDIKNVQGSMNVNIKALLLQISGDASVNYTDTSLSNITGYSFRLFGDILPDIVPQNIVDALIFMKSAPGQLKSGNFGRGKQISYILTPVNVLRKLLDLEIQESALIHDIGEHIVKRCVKLFDDMMQIEQQLNDLYTDLTKQEPYVRDHVIIELTDLLGNYSVYKSLTTRALSALLVQIRAGNETVEKLEEIIFKSVNDSYSVESMKLKVGKFEQLLNHLVLVDYVANINTENDKQCILNKHSNLEKLMLEFEGNSLYILYYSYDHGNNNSQQQNNIDAISAYKQLIKDNKPGRVYCSINYEIIDQAKQSILKLDDHGDYLEAKIALYKQGRLIQSNVLPLETSRASIYICGGYDGQNYQDKCYQFDLHKSTWSNLIEIKNMSIKRHHLKLIDFNNIMYAIGGRDDISTNFVETYDTRDNLWTQISSLNIRRDGLGATVLNDTLYVCGGYISDEQTGTNSCEYFQQESNEWKFLPSMSRKHHYHQLIAHSGYLYSIGGNVNNDDNRPSNFVEKYDLANKSWTPVASMINERSSFGSVSFMDKLYVCGGKGYTESAALNSCEMYDSITDKWIQIAPMQEKRVYMELLKYNDKLYAIGGENLNTFEVYDYKSNSWSHTTLLPTKMWDFGAAVIKEV
ncbi:uncharacterized protein LOC128965244 [Oppia nitens]|uniref:uncharacterized protein LOC128965244 n=1 Tax=Oppia nitens TaxID=1686743 RepID=UPI0023DB89E2|nr:uncharacterized protein LOC128965244 [Oppia nitens]